MSVYKQYTLTSKQTLVGFYRCPQCGNNNLFLFECVSKDGYNTKGAIRKSTIESRGFDAQNRLKDKHRQRINDILWESDRHNYKPANIRCKCQKCGAIEPWTKYRLPLVPLVSTLAKYVLFFSGMFCILMMLEDVDSFEIFTTPAISALVWLVCIIADMINTRIRNKQVARIDPVNLPIIEETPDALIAKIKKKFPDEEELFGQNDTSSYV